MPCRRSRLGARDRGRCRGDSRPHASQCDLTSAAQTPREPLPAEPLGAPAQAIYPCFEGWGPHKDGTTVILLGYYNRNRRQTLDIPIGPDNRIEPGGPDYGQPTHFEASQQHGVFAIEVPQGLRHEEADVDAEGQRPGATVSFWLNPPYWLDFFKNAANGNEPPVVRFAAEARGSPARRMGIAQTAVRRGGPADAADAVGVATSPAVAPGAADRAGGDALRNRPTGRRSGGDRRRSDVRRRGEPHDVARGDAPGPMCW